MSEDRVAACLTMAGIILNGLIFLFFLIFTPFVIAMALGWRP
jgi:hypothetical protein